MVCNLYFWYFGAIINFNGVIIIIFEIFKVEELKVMKS
jgi:hypothetical protein